jgi:hypothetical protein
VWDVFGARWSVVVEDRGRRALKDVGGWRSTERAPAAESEVHGIGIALGRARERRRGGGRGLYA